MGGSVAQQIATSLLTRGADKVVNNAYEAQQRETESRAALKDTPPDPYLYAFITSGFETIAPTVEALPASASTVDGTALIESKSGAAEPTPAANTNLASAQATRLVHVEIWNLIIGDEKNSLLEKARLLGAEVPPKNEWEHWKVATGTLIGDKNKQITFLIPPEFGRIGSGGRVVVEMTEPSQIHMARYAAN